MNKNEPTTGEIVRALRGCADKEIMCDECRYNMGNSFECLNKMQYEAADRLERQERELLQKTQELESAKIRHARKDAEGAELYEKAIARAESAERERDAAIVDIRRCCETCLHGQQSDIRCAIGVNGKCYFGGYDYWKWRGLQPQDGAKWNVIK